MGVIGWVVTVENLLYHFICRIFDLALSDVVLKFSTAKKMR